MHLNDAYAQAGVLEHTRHKFTSDCRFIVNSSAVSDRDRHTGGHTDRPKGEVRTLDWRLLRENITPEALKYSTRC